MMSCSYHHCWMLFHSIHQMMYWIVALTLHLYKENKLKWNLKKLVLKMNSKKAQVIHKTPTFANEQNSNNDNTSNENNFRHFHFRNNSQANWNQNWNSETPLKSFALYIQTFQRKIQSNGMLAIRIKIALKSWQ